MKKYITHTYIHNLFLFASLRGQSHFGPLRRSFSEASEAEARWSKRVRGSFIIINSEQGMSF